MCIQKNEYWKKLATALSTNSSNPKYKWWCSAELARRLLIIAITLPLPGNEVCTYIQYSILNYNRVQYE